MHSNVYTPFTYYRNNLHKYDCDINTKNYIQDVNICVCKLHYNEYLLTKKLLIYIKTSKSAIFGYAESYIPFTKLRLCSIEIHT